MRRASGITGTSAKHGAIPVYVIAKTLGVPPNNGSTQAVTMWWSAFEFLNLY
jgi:hypothetical protein